MATIELEAAEALTGLAHSAMLLLLLPLNSNQEGRPTQRVKTESPAGTSPEASLRRSSDPTEDHVVVVQKQCENIGSVMMKKVKVEHDAELTKPSLLCTTSNASFSGCKSRQKLTEAEKEARRIRRVLANRESARKTIRRRQALYEELTRKAANLAWENENLKQEKELAVKECDSLKNTNECLKAQMAKTRKTEVEEPRVDSKSTNAKISTSPCTNCPFLIYNQPPFTPFLWPAIIQSSNPVQLQNGSQNGIVVPSKIPMPAVAKPDSLHEQGNPLRINGPGTPLYILPFPWFFPLPDHGNGLHLRPSFDMDDDQNGTSMNNQCSASSSTKTIVNSKQHCPSLPMKDEMEAFSSTKAMSANNNLHETPFGFPPDDGGQHTGLNRNGVVFMPTPLKLVKPASTVKHGTGQQLDNTANVQAFSSAVSHTVNALPEMKKDPIVCPSKKQVGANLAAEARKRRKELTKLKSLHCRRMF